MISKKIRPYVTASLILIVLTGCGEKGLDKKFDFTSSQEDLSKSLADAMEGARPEEQNILRERFPDLMFEFTMLAANSNPATVDAFVAKKNADKMKEFSDMSIRNLLIMKLESYKTKAESKVDIVEGFYNNNNLVCDGFTIEDVDIGRNAEDAMENGLSYLPIKGTMTLRNNSSDLGFYVGGCPIELSVDNQIIQKFIDGNYCVGSKEMAPGGGRYDVKVSYGVKGKESSKLFLDNYKNGEIGKILVKVNPYGPHSQLLDRRGAALAFYIASEKVLNEDKEDLRKIDSDLAVLKGGASVLPAEGKVSPVEISPISCPVSVSPAAAALLAPAVVSSSSTAAGSQSAGADVIQVGEEEGLKSSLCQPDEKIVFSCDTEKKSISVCASGDLSPSSGYVQYRFGNKEKLDISFPEPRQHPRAFATAKTLMYSGGGGAYMKFKNGNYSYIVYTGIGKEWEAQGVVVEKDGTQIANVECKAGYAGDMGSDFFEKYGITEDESEFEVPH